MISYTEVLCVTKNGVFAPKLATNVRLSITIFTFTFVHMREIILHCLKQSCKMAYPSVSMKIEKNYLKISKLKITWKSQKWKKLLKISKFWFLVKISTFWFFCWKFPGYAKIFKFFSDFQYNYYYSKIWKFRWSNFKNCI